MYRFCSFKFWNVAVVAISLSYAMANESVAKLCPPEALACATDFIDLRCRKHFFASAYCSKHLSSVNSLMMSTCNCRVSNARKGLVSSETSSSNLCSPYLKM